MKRVTNVMLLLALILIMPTATRACMCSNASFSPINAFYGADVVFVGKVTKITNAKQASVGLVVKEAGTLALLKVPRWEKSVFPARIVTLEVSESFKGEAGQTFQLVTARYANGATCGVNFKVGEAFLVYAGKRQLETPTQETSSQENQSATEIQLKEEANKYNERLPGFQTTICARTERMRWAKGDVDVIRDILKNGYPGVPSKEAPVRHTSVCPSNVRQTKVYRTSTTWFR